MKIKRLHIIRLFAFLLLLMTGSMTNKAWAAKVTYHILTLPIDPSTRYDYHMVSGVTDHRLEAIKVIIDNQTTVELPAHYKSPLATNFKYYKPEDITIGAVTKLFDNTNNPNKGIIYDIKAGSEAKNVPEGTVIAGTTAEYYVVYTYNESNTIAKLDGTVSYNIATMNKDKGVYKDKGFISYNRGRNNRPAVVPTAKVDPEMLASPDFMKVENPGAGIATYWVSGDNKNKREDVESQFHFIFQFEGKDPYNIIIRNTYNRDYTYIEKNDDGDKKFVYKWYKGGQLFSVGTANSYIASDIHKRYQKEYNSAIPNPTDLIEGTDYVNRNGQFHGQGSAIWGSYAILNNNDNNGYVFMGTRTVDGNGATPDAPYYLKEANNCNNLVLNKVNAENASNNLSIKGIYPIKKVTFKVPTPFYAVEPTSAHIISVSDWVSQYTVENDPIETKYLPTSLKRKYCTFNGKFYKDAARTNEITKFSDADYDPTEGYQVYLDYDVSASIPFKTITPAASYSADTWADATWYELTDATSSQIDGMKLKYDGSSNFKNDGGDGEYAKTSEFAFIGDPYELQVVYRNSTSGDTPYFVGATGTPPSTGTALTISTSATEGYKWQLTNDAVEGSFLLQKYKDEGNWYWEVTRPAPVAINYGTKTHTYNVATANAQAVTFNVSNLTYEEGRYITITKGGTNSDQVTLPTERIYVQSGGVASFTVAIKARGGSDKQFTLSVQEYDASNAAQESPSVITVNQNSSTISSHTVQYSTASSTRVKVMELPKFTYTYNMVDTHGNIAIKGTISQTIFSALTKASIPSIILSPYLADETVTFYSSFTEGDRSNLSGVITKTPATNNANIYVSYTTDNLASKSIHLDDDQRFKVQLNGEYLYYDTKSGMVLSTEAIGAGDYYSWQLEGLDPYAMKIKNVGKGEYVKVASWGNDQALGFDASISNASRFIAMLSNYGGIYEVMAATGDETPYLYIARPSTTGAEAKIYNYTHGADQLRFVLSGEQPVYYHLIDKAGEELLIASSYNARLTLPAEYVSPLVDTYYYYPTEAKALTDNHKNNITEIKDDTNEDGTQTDGKGDNHVYVTYTVNDLIGFNNSGKINENPYLLKFLEPYADGYYLEDGADKLIPYDADAEDGRQGRIQAIYPYCNGDGNLNIYGERMRDEQMDGGSSTRPRWVWFFESANNDPYHVRIHSRSTISYKSVSHPTYLQTYAVHFKQDSDPDTEHIVTGGALPGVASETPTEYMILGLAGAYKLLTTQEISADEDGSGTITSEETKRREVTSLEQYWKTYNMLKLHVLGIAASTDAYSTDKTTWVVPDDKRETLKTNLETLYIDGDSWHSYDVYANATRWNGYNDKSDGHEKKVVEKLEHWFQTFDMGNGTFNVESADIPPVLVLLDQHGWEIMRKPLPTTNYPEGDEELAALRVYDSPLVDKYYFYSNATKATGCHKYTLRLDDKGKERDQITVDGVHYSSTSLGNLPPANAKGVKSSGVLNDQFVIYTVKEEYASNYAYNLTYTGNKDDGYTITSETGTSQPYLVLQHGRFYKAKNTLGTNPSDSYFSKPIIEHTNPEGGNVYDMIISPHNHGGNNNPIIDGSGNFIGNNFWYVKPNMNIDKEMGIKWGTAHSGSEPLSENATKVTYKDKSGFDPYNMQLQLVNDNDGTPVNKYLTTHMTSAHLDNGIMVGDYSGSGGTTKITLEDPYSYGSPYDAMANTGSTGYDHTNLHISNQTFMAVQDANGNMQLMPRFDHTKRISLSNTSPWETQLTDPEDHAKASLDDNSSQGSQTTFFVRPQCFKYHIIDNNGREALIYQRAADFYPGITDHFKSPIATDFTYYKGLAVSASPESSTESAWDNAKGVFQRTATSADMLTDLVKLLPTAGTYQYKIGTRGVFSYKSVVVSKGLSEQQITGSFAAVDLDNVDENVYVRYNYDEDADLDADRILQGQWFTVKLSDKDLQADGTIVTTVGSTQGTGVDLYAGEAASRSLTAADNTEYATKRDALTATGDYYFRVGTDPSYTYNKVTVTTVPISSASDYTETLDGSYATKWSDSKPLVVDSDGKKWQWKFLAAPTDPSSDYYVAPDPYAVQIYNRMSNYTTNPSLEPSPMGVAIKVPNANDGTDRYALLSHPSGGYALVVAKTYSDYDYYFLNGASMTVPSTTAAGTAKETAFTYKVGNISNGSQILVNNDVVYNYTYKVVNNSSKLAITAEQNTEEAASHDYVPYLPLSAQTPLLNMEDYVYYGFANYVVATDTYSVIPQTKLYTLSGLYDDVVWVRYGAYEKDKSNYLVPNKRNETGTGQVTRHSDSNDATMNINGDLPYNIIWYNDNMMSTSTAESATIADAGSKDLSGDAEYVWYFKGNDPYSLEIEHKKTGLYVNGTGTLVELESGAMQFMLLKKTGYDYGILQVTGTTGSNAGKKLTGYGNTLTADASTDPTKFIIFGLSVHDLIYRLIIAKTCPDKDNPKTDEYVEIPYREGDDDDYTASYKWTGDEKKIIFGTTQRNLTAGTPAGSTYQLGTTISWGGENHTYSHHAGTVSLGDNLKVPNVFYRPNCTFEYYIEGIYNLVGTSSEPDLDNRFKGLKVDKLMTTSDLINKTVVVNVVYKFDTEVATNTGLGFVTSLNQNLWYTFENPKGTTPYLAHYTNAWGLQAMEGEATRYTNDYLWTPLGDVYGFKMYNRYMNKTSGSLDNVMTMNNIAEGKNLYLAIPGTTVRPAGEEGAGTVIPEDYGIFELITGDQEGYFRVHPIANTGETKYYVRRGGSDYAVLSTTPSDWNYGLDMTLMEPYYQRAGYVGGLTPAGKTAYENIIKEENWKITDLQKIVYDDDNIVHYTPGYYRLHNQPGVSGMDTVRYASGYLHEIEKTAVSGGIPMHFYSKVGISTTFAGEDGLGSGFTVTPATRGEVPVDSTEVDPSTIFYFSGNGTNDTYGNPTSTIQTQGLYVAANPNGDAANGTTIYKNQRAVMSDNSTNAITFSVMDIGGAVLLIHDGAAPARRRYLNFDQSVADSIYDLRFYHESPTDDAKWCMQPVQKTTTAGSGEMPLRIKTHNGGEGYYYTTFYAPFDVLLPVDAGGHIYNAYICKQWHNEGVNPTPVPAHSTYTEGKFVPAGTPVIIRTNDESEYVTLTLPNTSPSSSLSCVFTGSYLEQLLSAANPARDVYTLGLPMTSTVSKDGDYVTSGGITAPLPEFTNTGVGFYINATPNKEADALQSLWKRNNLYVLHNKIYYRAPAVSPARGMTRSSVDFVPIIFDDLFVETEEYGREQNEDEEVTERREYVGDGCVYDMQGRRVATEEQVLDGTWKQRVSPGIYIFNGKKISIK